jgi:hypothetical protein
MISEKQLEANQENAKLGGVKTEEGKAVSKLNAIKHGLLTREALLDGENEQELKELTDNIYEQFTPKGELEKIFCDRIASSVWRLSRAIKVEKNIMEFHSKDDFGKICLSQAEGQGRRMAIMDMIINDDIEKIIRYESSIERGIYKALHELQRIQATRKGEDVPLPVSVDIDFSKDE